MGHVVMCGTLAVFAAGTLGDKTFGFPKASHRMSMIDHVTEGRNNRREDTGGAGEVTRKDENTCTPNSDEYDHRVEALGLEYNERYMRAVREEIVIVLTIFSPLMMTVP